MAWSPLARPLELLTGLPGMGKSQVHCQFVASVTTGRAWPDGTNGIAAHSVIMLTAEDCLDQILVPRLIAANADLERVRILKKIRRDDKDRLFLLSEDIEILAKIIAEVGDVGLVTIDPITAYMGGKVDSHRATDVRSQLGPLAELAERMDVAFSAITHPAKNAGQRAIDHFIGSQAFIAAARIGHMCIEETEDERTGQARADRPRTVCQPQKQSASKNADARVSHYANGRCEGCADGHGHPNAQRCVGGGRGHNRRPSARCRRSNKG